MGNQASQKTTNALQERNISEKEKYDAVVKKYRSKYGQFADINKKYPEKGIYEDDRVNPLMIAVEKTELEDVKILIAGGADVNEVAFDSMIRVGLTPLMMAIKQQDVNDAYLQQEEDYENDEKAVGLKSKKEYIELALEIFNYLLDKGADPNIESFWPKGLTALHFAAWHHLPLKEIKKMVERMTVDSINKKAPETNKTALDIFYGYLRRHVTSSKRLYLQEVIDFLRLKGGESNFYEADGSPSLPGLMGKETNLKL